MTLATSISPQVFETGSIKNERFRSSSKFACMSTIVIFSHDWGFAMKIVTTLAILTLTLPAWGADSPQDVNRPNVLFLLADDQRPDTIAALGNEVIHTPHLDRLVREGTTFTRAITAIPICVASRAEILTGRDGRLNGKDDFGWSPAPDAVALGTALREAGYATCYTGKWHTRGRPSDFGYQQALGLFGGGGGEYPLNHPFDWKGMPVTGYTGWIFQSDSRELYPGQGVGLTPDISAKFADAAVQYIRREHPKPFFLHVNFTAPHDPLLMPTGFADLYNPKKIPLPENFAKEHPFDHGNFDGRDEQLFAWPRTPEQTRGALEVYYALITHMDTQIGRILKALEQTGQLDNTIIIYSSDHGLAIGSHGLRGKQNMYEHTIGVPLIFRGPGIPADRRTAAQCYLRDLYPTICDLCDVPIPDTVTAKSLKPILDGSQEPIHQAVFAHFRDSQRAIRTDRWKYIRYPLADREQLFDLKQDPLEQNNVADDPQFAETLKRLRKRLTTWEDGS